MRWFKFVIIVVLVVGGIYAVSMNFVAENKNFTIQKEIDYPVDKVFPQFNNLQNFTRWNSIFTENNQKAFQFFTPYEGKGSAMSYRDKKDSDVFGEIFIRYENHEKTLKDQ